MMSIGHDERGADPSVNYEPSVLAGMVEADESYREYTPYVEGHIVRESIDRTNDYGQAGERYRTIEQWERDDLVLNLSTGLSQCAPILQEKMIEHFTRCDKELGQRVAEGIRSMSESQSEKAPMTTLA